MSNKKIITAIGSAGSQGGSAARAITRDPSEDKAKKLVERGTEAVALAVGKGNLNNKFSLVKGFTGATAVFDVTNHWESMSIDPEIQQGKNIADAAKVFTDGNLPHVYHFNGKARIEEYARECGVPSSFFLPGKYLQSLIDFFRQNEGARAFAAPMPESAPIPIFDVRDTGQGVKESMGTPNWVAGEVLENMQLVAERGYFAFEPLDDTHAALVGNKPTSSIDFLRGHESLKDLKQLR
ncbi:uncharacterized protein FTJAE_14251 [Fusarium tjaetaba]|uniref:NmrA-like domain-containing protein n=1 Tax=Fusarium tjaetaba TaxID=1567544 RepID=A0A8H5Q6P1_9HYPO|nr:uncharacterized protein FTJAE_14251 [Fusarium tjaetaba]KAF5610585.1 hypothetical protein FTJAE_14251 [Fusarium tjaetaba]